MPKIQSWQNFFSSKATPLQPIHEHQGVQVMVKRDDLNHPLVQGNKWRKLKYNIKHAIDHNHEVIATFGGAYSNHILACAAAASLCGLSSIGFIRGDELQTRKDRWSDTLRQAERLGMRLVFINRQAYRLKENATEVIDCLEKMAAQPWFIEEGGSNALALQGVAEMVEEVAQQAQPIDAIISACATGGTIAGIIDGVAKHKNIGQVIGVPVLKGAGFLYHDIRQLSKHHGFVDWQLALDYHAGGYAKMDDKTRQFALSFSQQFHIPLDPVYTAKSFFAAHDLIEKCHFKPGSSVLILHTGGLQGGTMVC